MWVTRVEIDRTMAQFVRLGKVGVGTLRPTEKARIQDRDRQRRRGLRILRIDRQRAAEKGLRLDIVLFGVPVMVPDAMLIEFIRVLAALRPLGNALAFKFEEFRLYSAGDRVGDLVLQFKQIGQIAVVSLGHYVMVGVGPDQLHRDADSLPRFAYAAFEDIAYAQLLADLFDVDGLALVSEGRIARDHREGAPARKH